MHQSGHNYQTLPGVFLNQDFKFESLFQHILADFLELNLPTGGVEAASASSRALSRSLFLLTNQDLYLNFIQGLLSYLTLISNISFHHSPSFRDEVACHCELNASCLNGAMWPPSGDQLRRWDFRTVQNYSTKFKNVQLSNQTDPLLFFPLRLQPLSFLLLRLPDCNLRHLLLLLASP